MLKFLVQIEAKPGPTVAFDSSKPIDSYYQLLGVTADNQAELVQLVREYIYKDLGSTLVEVVDMWVPNFENQDANIKDVCEMNRVGVWYYSGHAWFSGDEDEQGDDEAPG